jgi:hypothetical protein
MEADRRKRHIRGQSSAQRLVLLGLLMFLGGCVKALPPENYSITVTSHECDDAGVCQKVTREFK